MSPFPFRAVGDISSLDAFIHKMQQKVPLGMEKISMEKNTRVAVSGPRAFTS